MKEGKRKNPETQEEKEMEKMKRLSNRQEEGIIERKRKDE